jgi:signal transduction histidine kinase/streptogramin lyase
LTGLHIDQEDKIWVGVWGEGVTCMSADRKVFTHYRHDPSKLNSLSSAYPTFLCGDTNKGVWIGTNGSGIDLLDKATNQITHFRHNHSDSASLNNNYILCLFVDSRGTLWVGTAGGGLSKYEGKKNAFLQYTSKPTNPASLSNDYVYSIRENSKGNLWIATGNGLNRFDSQSGRFRVYRQKDGLPGNTINAIEVDKHGQLWVSSNHGISKFDPEKGSFTNYSLADGLVNNEFTSASLKSRTGELYFGSPNGFTVFHPDSIKNNPVIPPVYITGFQVFNKEIAIGGKEGLLGETIEQTKEITLSYRQSVFSLEFAALNYTSPEKNQYAYKMENFDRDWNYVGNKRTATYTNLDAGTYYFHVKAFNNDGLWNEQGTTIKIVITPPIWQTWWFKLMLIAAMLVGAIAIYGWRMNAIEAEKNQLAQQNQTLEKINSELDSFVYRASHDLKAPSTSILGLINVSKLTDDLDSKGQYLELMEKSVQKLDTFILSIITYSKNSRVESVAEPIDFRHLLEESLEALHYQEGFDQLEKQVDIHQLLPFYGDKFRLTIIFTNILSNAIKYRSALNSPNWIRIYIQVDAHKAVIEFEDNGRGIAQDSQPKIFDMFYRATDQGAGSGLGLYIVKETISRLKGKIELRSQLGIGTSFYIELPNEKGKN